MLRKKMFKVFKILFFSVLSLLLITVLTIYFSLHRALPDGIEGAEADAFAKNILKAVKHEAFLKTDFIQWSFRNKNHYVWDKTNEKVEVKWDDYSVVLNLNKPQYSKVKKGVHTLQNKEAQKIIKKALKNFNNDSFWVIAPHKLFDAGTKRALVTLEDQSKALLVTYHTGGTTPGDSYLWKVDQNYLPTSYQMWVSIIPIGGIEATWEHWTPTQSGAYLSQKHQLLGFGIPVSNLETWRNE